MGYHIWEAAPTTRQMDPDFSEYYGVRTAPDFVSIAILILLREIHNQVNIVNIGSWLTDSSWKFVIQTDPACHNPTKYAHSPTRQSIHSPGPAQSREDHQFCAQISLRRVCFQPVGVRRPMGDVYLHMSASDG